MRQKAREYSQWCSDSMKKSKKSLKMQYNKSNWIGKTVSMTQMKNQVNLIKIEPEEEEIGIFHHHQANQASMIHREKMIKMKILTKLKTTLMKILMIKKNNRVPLLINQMEEVMETIT